MPTPQIITIGKQSYLAGLTWRSLDEQPDKDDLRTEAKALSADLYALRPVTPEIIQAGFCATPVLDPKTRFGKTISLAATAAGILKEPWLGIYQISDNLFWYIAVRDSHTILPDGDVIGTREEVDEAWSRHAGYKDWNQVEGNLADLIALLDQARAIKGPYSKPVYIKPLYSKPIPPAVYIGIAVTLTLAAGGAYWFHTYNLQKEQAIAAQLAAARAALSQKKPPVILPPAVLAQPLPDEWLAACRKTIGSTPLAQYGWTLISATCAETSATLEWKRTELATVAQHPDCRLSNDGNTCIGVLPIDIKMEGPDNRDTMPAARVSFQTWAQTRYLDVQLNTDSKPEAKSLPGAPAPAADPSLPTIAPQGTFSLSLPYPPEGLQLDSVPGARLTSLKFDLEKWEMAGVLYGK